MPTPSPSPLASLLPPSAGESLARCTTPAALPSPPLPPPLHMPPPVDRRDDIPETEMPPRKRLCLSTLGFGYEVGDSSTARPTRGRGIDYGFVSTLDAEARRQGIGEVGYGIRDTWVNPTESVPEIAPMTMGEAVHYELQTYQEQVYAHEFPLQTYQTQLQLQSTLIQTQHQLHETRFQMQQTEIAELRETDHAALTWWNSQIRSLGPGAYSMTWKVLKKKMTDKYCPQSKIKKLEIKLWNLKVKENNDSAYTEHFQELTLICTKFVDDETEKIDKYISGLPDNIYRSVNALKPKMLDETTDLANDLMDQKLRTYAEWQSNKKRKADESFKNNHGHQQQTPKRQNVVRVYNMGTGERKPYSENFPKCTKCHFHHNGPCTQKCHKCNKVGHFARDCRSSGNANVANAQRNNGSNPNGNGCFECGASGHFKRDCPKLKNKDAEKGNRLMGVRGFDSWGLGAQAHGDVGRGCGNCLGEVQVYRKACGGRRVNRSFWREN
uniref:CCHC-type domain-containing protein n=1 Tax=Tanacetum cinerariifolium TaxID=118510 RepID=A0A6L2N1U2_TANCI|nr:hypothetical protein [Tanacetum cinerariifolium]